MAQLQSVDIPTEHGHLEGLLRLPDGLAATPRPALHLAAVVCHPHPLYGGTMHTKPVFRIAQALVAHGVPTLRFNFRGVGRSTGRYDEGAGEADDVRAALTELGRRFPGVPLCVGGVSFGAWVGLPVGCADARVRLLLGSGVPTSLLGTHDLAGCHQFKLIVQGEHDEYGPLATLRPWFDALPEPKRLVVVPGSDHLFTNHQTELATALDAALSEVLPLVGV